jgi:protease-4
MSFSRKCLAFGMYCLISFPLFSQGMYLELNLNDPNRHPFAQPKPPLEIFRVIEKAAGDSNVRGIILNAGAVSIGRDFLWELRDVLEQFKSGGKKVCAFISNADIDVYCLASAADKIVMDELGTLTLLGYSVGRGYMKHTLEKLGIGVRELRYFEYKSASEMFTRDSMSEADRRQYNDYLDDIFGLTRDTLKNARNWTDEEFDTILNREFLYSARSAKNRGLVDHVGRKAAVLEALREIEGAEVKNFALYGEPASSLTGSTSKYTSKNAGGGFFKKTEVIAVVYADGQTDMQAGMNAVSLSKTIRELADKGRVKAIVIRINSPGGSAEAADHFAEAVRYAKQKKPVVVSMGEVAASGGYWAAIYANHIAATPYTITGSIGVIGSWFYDNGLNSKLGITVDTIQRGAHADLLTGVLFPRRNLSSDEEGRYKSYILDLYNIFIEKTAAGRGMEIGEVEAVAQGRVYSGKRALEAGLIDSIGGLSGALRTARTLAEISENSTVKYEEYPKPKFLDKFMESFPFASIFFSKKNKSAGTASFFADLFFPDKDIRYRLENNCRVMPILPLEFSFRHIPILKAEQP